MQGVHAFHRDRVRTRPQPCIKARAEDTRTEETRGGPQWRRGRPDGVAVVGIFHDLPLDAEEDPHPAADDLGKLDPEDDQVALAVRVEVRRELRGPCQAQHEVDEDRERVYGEREKERLTQAVRVRPVFFLVRERVGDIVGCVV